MLTWIVSVVGGTIESLSFSWRKVLRRSMMNVARLLLLRLLLRL